MLKAVINSGKKKELYEWKSTISIICISVYAQFQLVILKLNINDKSCIHPLLHCVGSVISNLQPGITHAVKISFITNGLIFSLKKVLASTSPKY